MGELPKELTAKLLSLVLDQEVKENSLFIRDNYLNYYALSEKLEVSAFREFSLNIDTLTRLMIEKIREWNYIFNIFTSTSLQGFGGSIGNGGYSKKLVSDTMFDMALEAFHWIAKEKGLI